MSDIDLGNVLGTVIVGGMAMKMVDKMDSHDHERREHKHKRKTVKRNNGYTHRHNVFGTSKNSPL